jgi:hypothetical protein
MFTSHHNYKLIYVITFLTRVRSVPIRSGNELGQDGQCTYNIILRRVRGTTVVVEKLSVLVIAREREGESVCVCVCVCVCVALIIPYAKPICRIILLSVAFLALIKFPN